MAILSGKRLGPYEILSAIGAGGMGEVYRTQDTARSFLEIAFELARKHAD